LSIGVLKSHIVINPNLTLSKFVSKPILKKIVLTKCHSEVSEIVDAVMYGHKNSKVPDSSIYFVPGGHDANIFKS
jgi:hypothetical protein